MAEFEDETLDEENAGLGPAQTNKQAELESLPETVLYHPNGFSVTVKGKDRAKELRRRGYTDKAPRSSGRKKEAVEE